jgi:hypothetical protein
MPPELQPGKVEVIVEAEKSPDSPIITGISMKVNVSSKTRKELLEAAWRRTEANCPVLSIFKEPMHPYTRMLLSSIPVVSEAEEGRRIRRVDGGFFVVNYQKYRAFTYSDSPSAIRQRRHREKERDIDSTDFIEAGKRILEHLEKCDELRTAEVLYNEHELLLPIERDDQIKLNFPVPIASLSFLREITSQHHCPVASICFVVRYLRRKAPCL